MSCDLEYEKNEVNFEICICMDRVITISESWDFGTLTSNLKIYFKFFCAILI